MKKITAALVLALGAFTFPVVALATVIDFSGVPAGCIASYAESGVTFSATDGLGITATGFGNTPNGTPGITSCATPSSSTLRAQFASLFSGTVSIDLGTFSGHADIFLTLFDALNNVLATTSGFGFGMLTLSLSASGIDHAIFGGDGGGGSNVYSDNFTFVGAVSNVSEPATLALLGIALAGLGITRRRKPN